MKKITGLLLLALLSTIFTSCSESFQEREFSINLIPLPVKIEKHDGYFEISEQTKVCVVSGDVELNRQAIAISAFFSEQVNYKLPIVKADSIQSNAINLVIDETLSNLTEEGYTLYSDQTGITLSSSNPEGIYRGFQTLRQLLPSTIEKAGSYSENEIAFPAIRIIDQPRFRWRGMLLDCGRHFMSVEFVKRYIDLLAYHKMNILHWHLTEDQGWRIEIKKYPKLTEVGAWRTNEDGTRYGGFYTQEQIKEIVKYAEERYVTIIPEIELPGHSVAALAAYPHLSCTGGPFEVETAWGVHEDVYCAGKEETFEFLEDVLSEVIELFPATYIHIGGDECPKARWEECPDCQARIENEGLKDEHELQSYFIARIERFLNSRNRQIIGWDEILEGGLAPGATVQSWRGMDGAIAAAKSGHYAIVSPTSHAYFDYPLENIDLEKVYSFDPIPEELEEAEKKYILGGECNMWTERAPQELVDSKVFPRILAMSEVLWSYPPNRNFEEFRDRVQHHYPRLDNMGVKYGPESKPVTIEVDAAPETGVYSVNMKPGEDGLSIYYNLSADIPDTSSALFEKPFTIDSSTVLTARAYKGDKIYGKPERIEIVVHLALGKEVTYLHKYNRYYPGGGDSALVDGFKGNQEKHNDGHWQAWAFDDMEAIIDLGEEKEINSISADFMYNPRSWIHLPESVAFYISRDGKDYQEINRIFADSPVDSNKPSVVDYSVTLESERARYIKVVADNIGVNPEGHSAAGKDSWIFCDEIIVK